MCIYYFSLNTENLQAPCTTIENIHFLKNVNEYKKAIWLANSAYSVITKITSVNCRIVFISLEM